MNFNINDTLSVTCEHKDTRNGFKHTAKLYENGYFIKEIKCCYLNRTWERFEFDTVLQQLADKTKHPEIREFVEKRTSDSGTEHLKSIAAFAKMSSFFVETTEEKNTLKKRMLQAGLGENVNFPDDFDSLSEEEKEKRLDGAINSLGKI